MVELHCSQPLRGGTQMRPHIFAVVMTLAMREGCATKPAGRLANVTEARLLVTAGDVPQLRSTRKDQDGKETVVAAGEQVKNLEQVSVGDEVVVSYTE